MKKGAIIVFSFLVLFTSFPCFSEINKNHNNIFFELCGSAGLYSINYEHMVFNLNNAGMFGFRIGFAFYLGKNISMDIPVMLTLVLGSTHMFELGIGIDPKLNFGDNVQAMPSFVCAIGYRFSPKEGGLSYRIVYTPYFNHINLLTLCWIGLSIGLIF